MRRSYRCFLLCAPFVVMALLTVPFGQRSDLLMPEPVSLDHWDIPQLTAYLNEAGVTVHAEPVQKNGDLNYSAYLTSTPKEWDELCLLIKDARWTRAWRGIVYCVCEASNAADLASQWGDHGLLVRPFVFYGDTELLCRIKAALNHRAQVDEP